MVSDDLTLSTLTHSPSFLSDNLEANVERASSGVVHGNEQLGRAVTYKVRQSFCSQRCIYSVYSLSLQKCSRKLCCVISTILITIFLLIVLAIIIVAVVLNKSSGK